MIRSKPYSMATKTPATTCQVVQITCDDEIFARMEENYANNDKERSIMAVPYNMTFFNGQRLDHFNLQDNRTWSQRFASSLEFWGGPGKLLIDSLPILCYSFKLDF